MTAGEAADRSPGRPVAGRRPWHPATHLALLHPAPATAVVTTGLGFAAVAWRGRPDPRRFALLAAMLSTMQYAAGALNDAVDVDDDRAAGRPKPIVAGDISEPLVWALSVGAGAASLAFAAPLGRRTAALDAVGLASAWAYDLWLKRTPASALPFAVAVPLVPLFGYAAAGRFPAVLWWVWPIGGLAAIAIHLADALPDVESDRAAGSAGLAARLGVGRATACVAACYTAAVAAAVGSGIAEGDPGAAIGGGAAATLFGVLAGATGSGGPAARRRAYRLLLAGLVSVAAGWALAVRP